MIELDPTLLDEDLQDFINNIDNILENIFESDVDDSPS